MVAINYQQEAELSLHHVLTNPKLLRSFESFLRQTLSHENLLFVEAMTQLRHETIHESIEISLHRIYKTFIAPGAPLELHVTTRDQVKDDIDALQWAIVSRQDAVAVFEQTERQVMAQLNEKLAEFLRINGNSISQVVRSSDPCKHQIRVVIIGGGFTGFTVASILDPMPLFHVTLIDTKDSFEYTPGIVRRIVNPEESSSLRVRHDAYVQNGNVIIGYVDDITDDAHSVHVNGTTIFFDYLVIATGSSYASQLKSTDVSSLYRLSGLEQVNAELIKAQRILVVGGGLVGCELASEIAQRHFPGEYPKKHVTLVESHSNVTHRSEPSQQQRALDYLLDLGIEVMCNERIIDYDMTDKTTYLGSSGRVYRGYDKVFIATGTRPNTQVLVNSTNDPPLDVCLDDWMRIRVKPTLQLDHWKYRHIFAGGDVTNVVEEKTGYAATLAGVCIARNICRLVKGKEPLRQGTKGTMPAPDRPLHGIASQGGIGKQKLNGLKKKFAFLNPSWAALKCFDEQQYLRMVQGEAAISSQVLGRLPRRLAIPEHGVAKSGFSDYPLSTLRHKASQHSFSRNQSSVTLNSSLADISKSHSHLPPLRSSNSSSTSSGNSSESSLEEFVFNHITYGDHGEPITRYTGHRQRSSRSRRRMSATSAYSASSSTPSHSASLSPNKDTVSNRSIPIQ